jgi:uncharacterized protein YkwD
MRRFAPLVCALALVGLSSAPTSSGGSDRLLAPPGVCAGDQTVAAGPGLGAEEQTMACLINYARGKRGLRSLRSSPSLVAAAQLRLAASIRCNTLSHSACGEPFEAVFRRTGYLTGAVHYALGENLGWGQGNLGSPRALMEAWLGSPPHRANLLRPLYRELGVAVVASDNFLGYQGVQLWATEFGSRTVER